MANDLTLEFEPRTLGKEEHKVLNELKHLLERQRGKISSIRLAGLAATALKISLGKADRPEDRMAKALARGLTTRQRLAVEEGGSVSSEEAAHLLGISKTAVLKRHQAGRLLGLRGERQGAVRFPVWQFDEGIDAGRQGQAQPLRESHLRARPELAASQFISLALTSSLAAPGCSRH